MHENRGVTVKPELCSEQQLSSCDIPVLWFCLSRWPLSLASLDPAAAVGPPAAPVEPAQLHSPELWSYGCTACSGPEHPYLKKPPHKELIYKTQKRTSIWKKRERSRLLPVLTSSLMSSSFMRMVTESSLIFCCAWNSPHSETPSKLFRLPRRDVSPALELATQRFEGVHKRSAGRGNEEGDRDSWQPSRFKPSCVIVLKHQHRSVLDSPSTWVWRRYGHEYLSTHFGGHEITIWVLLL